ncbi:MAG TPA: DnaJ family domain-containing protein [Micromonosporaceae bacterium]|nr:DnaJ family domain-containing protein [Micromonosporaceae bacterium]
MNRYESAVDRQIREAQERGAFDDLPGRGKPLPGFGNAYDEDWWIKDWIRRENITGVLPPSLALRREVEDLPQRLAKETSESGVRAVVDDLNERIRKAQRGLLDGPPVALPLFDVDEVVRAWRERAG